MVDETIDAEVPLDGPPDANQGDKNGVPEDQDIQWPPVDKGLPRRTAEWDHRISAPLDLVAKLGPMLAVPGLVFVGYFAEDETIVLNWLLDCIDTLDHDFETVLTCDFDADIEVPENQLCTWFCDLHDAELARAEPKRMGHWLALAIKPNLPGMFNDYAQLQQDLEHRGMTLICFVETGVYRRLPLGGFRERHIQVDTLDFAWRQMVSSLCDGARDEDFDEQHRVVIKVLNSKTKKEQIDKICASEAGRYRLRKGIQKALEEGEERLPEKACERAINLAVGSGKDGEIDKALRKYLGSSDSTATPGVIATLDDIETTENRREESFSIAIFVLWLCCRAEPGREDRVVFARYVDILRNYLKFLAADEEVNLKAARERAELEDRDVLFAVSQVKTPAKRLLERLDSVINAVVVQIGANRVQGADLRYIGYPEEIVATLSVLFSQQSAYVAHHMRLFSAALRPLRSNDPMLKRIGQMLFRYEAEQWGDLSESVTRDRVVEKFLELMQEESPEAWFNSVMHVLRPSSAMDAAQVVATRQVFLQLERHYFAVSVKQIVELIAVWYGQKSKDAVGEGSTDDLRRDFRRLVTALFKKLREKNKKPEARTFFRNLGAKQSDLIDLGAIARLILNHNDLDEIVRFRDVIQEAVLLHEVTFGKSRATDAELSRLKYAAYRFVVEELADEKKLSDRKVAHRWAVATLGLRVIHSCVASLREADYSTAPHPDFSTDPMMSRILAEKDGIGIDILVDTVMNRRIRDYPAQIFDGRAGLMAEHRGNDAFIAAIIDRELGYLASHSDRLWFKVADGEKTDDARATVKVVDAAQPEPTAASPETGGAPEDRVPSGGVPESGGEGGDRQIEKDSGAADKEHTDDATKPHHHSHEEGDETETDIRARRVRREFPVPRNDSEREDAIRKARLLPYRLLQEVHEMLLCSGRSGDAARLLGRLSPHLDRQNRLLIQNIVRQKKIRLEAHLRALANFRAMAERRGEDTAEVEQWQAFAARRLHQSARFEDVLET